MARKAEAVAVAAWQVAAAAWQAMPWLPTRQEPPHRLPPKSLGNSRPRDTSASPGPENACPERSRISDSIMQMKKSHHKPAHCQEKYEFDRVCVCSQDTPAIVACFEAMLSAQRLRPTEGHKLRAKKKATAKWLIRTAAAVPRSSTIFLSGDYLLKSVMAPHRTQN